MATTNHLGITLVEQSQAQKEVTVNMALTRIDAVLNTGAIDKDLSAPPGSPAEGAVYIIGASPTGDWTGKAKQVAYFEQVWRFVEPNEGMQLWVNDENAVYCYDGTNWIPAELGRIHAQTGTTYTLAAEDIGKIIDHANASAITVTLPNDSAVGFNVTYVQAGAGQITFSAASGALLRNRQSHAKTAGQWAVVRLHVRANSGGSAAEYVLSGDTAA